MNLNARLLFTKSQRLLCKADYSRVFNAAKRISTSHITLLYRANGLEHPRLGLMPSKKAMRRAVARNRFKRLARESFRLQQHQLPAVDIILLPKKGMTGFGKEQICKNLEELWEKLKRSSSAS